MTSFCVLIDGYFLQKPYGFGRFISELCRALGKAKTTLRFVVAVPSRVDLSTLPNYDNLTWSTLPDSNFILWEQLHIPRLALQIHSDLIHYPYNTRAICTSGIPVVTTVHDVLFLQGKASNRSPKALIAAFYSKAVFKMASGRSQAIVSVSATTQAALNRLGLKSSVVYNTVDGFVEAANPVASTSTQRPYLLHRGGYQPHRNTACVISAFREARKVVPNLGLKIVGAPDGATRWPSHDSEFIEFLPRLSDAELASCYAGCACVVATSLEEGFGLPIVEGFGFGVPVITSKLDPMQEVAGGAAILVDPSSSSDTAKAILAIFKDATTARRLVELGAIRKQAFSSDRVAMQMIDIYSRVALSEPPHR